MGKEKIGMSICTVCSSSTYESLASMTSLKALLSTTTTDDDDLMTDILKRATIAAEDFVGRPLRKQTYSEQVAGFGTQFLQVSHLPVQSIAQILQEEAVVSTTEYLLTSPEEGAIYRRYGWAWTVGTATDLVPHPMPGAEQLAFAVDYTAGYVPTSSTSTELGVPSSLEQAVLEISKAWYLGRKSNPNISSRRVGDLAITYGHGGATNIGNQNSNGRGGQSALPSTAQALLIPYQRIL